MNREQVYTPGGNTVLNYSLLGIDRIDQEVGRAIKFPS